MKKSAIISFCLFALVGCKPPAPQPTQSTEPVQPVPPPAPGRPQVEEKDDLAKIQGTWRLERGDSAGVPIPPNEVEKISIVYKQQSYVFIEGDVREEVGFTIDPKQNPKTMDGVRKPKGVSLKIYKLEGDTLTVCSALPGQPRPTSFNTNKDNRWEMLVLKRSK